MSNEKDPSILHFIQQRNSAIKLIAPAPSPKELDQLIQAALRAPDHARLKPARFLTVSGDGLGRLGQLFVDATEKNLDTALSDEQKTDILALTQRAPMILIPYAHLQNHPKVPEIEQKLSVACAVQNILLGCESLGYQAIWRTGEMAYDAFVSQSLGLESNEVLLGFIYIGTQTGRVKPIPSYDNEDFIRDWP